MMQLDGSQHRRATVDLSTAPDIADYDGGDCLARAPPQHCGAAPLLSSSRTAESRRLPSCRLNPIPVWPAAPSYRVEQLPAPGSQAAPHRAEGRDPPRLCQSGRSTLMPILASLVPPLGLVTVPATGRMTAATAWPPARGSSAARLEMRARNQAHPGPLGGRDYAQQLLASQGYVDGSPSPAQIAINDCSTT